MFSHLSSSIKAPLKYADEACGWEHGAVKWGVANAPCTPVTRCCYSPAKFRTGSSVAAAFCWVAALQVRQCSCWLWASISWRARARSPQGSGNPKGSALCLAGVSQLAGHRLWVWELLPMSGDEQQPAVFFLGGAGDPSADAGRSAESRARNPSRRPTQPHGHRRHSAGVRALHVVVAARSAPTGCLAPLRGLCCPRGHRSGTAGPCSVTCPQAYSAAQTLRRLPSRGSSPSHHQTRFVGGSGLVRAFLVPRNSG